MSDTLRSLNNIRTLRVQARECSLETLEELLEKLQSVVSERRELENSIKAELAERENKRIKLLEMIAKEGFDPADLVETSAIVAKVGKKISKRAPRPAKYEYKMESGEVKTWTGQGRMPSPIKDAIENEGKTLDDFLI